MTCSTWLRVEVVVPLISIRHRLNEAICNAAALGSFEFSCALQYQVSGPEQLFSIDSAHRVFYMCVARDVMSIMMGIYA